MTDIIQRLSNQILSRVTSGEVEDAAMEEIERLQTELAELRKEHKELFDGNHALMLENRELRKAQGEPVAWCVSTLGGLHVVSADHSTKYLFGLNDELLANALCRALNEAKLHTSAPTIQEGWQIVPVRPNSEMIEEAWSSNNYEDVVCTQDLCDAYKAMLAAAPKPTKDAA